MVLFQVRSRYSSLKQAHLRLPDREMVAGYQDRMKARLVGTVGRNLEGGTEELRRCRTLVLVSEA